MNPYLAAYLAHRPGAETAFALFREMCDYPVARVPGMDTVIRLAWRLECGRSPTEAALREWLYRVHLSTVSRICFGSPTLWGM